MQTYLFYDIETTGLDKAFDQVVQFAAIRTDLNFNELEQHEIKIKLNEDVVPSPYALITHQLSIKELQENGLTEIAAIEKIHELLNKPGTISVGYNTLGFDDEFLRFSFYRNLLPPYTHQFANNCKRMDIYPMTVMYYLYKRDIINWPTKDDCLTLKLEHLSDANNLATGNAHDAMVDVQATLALAQKFKQEQKMWDYLCGFFDKDQDQLRQFKLDVSFHDAYGKYREGLIIDGKFGADCGFIAPVINIGNHNHYSNQSLWLRLDLPELRTTTIDNVTETTWVISKRFGDVPFVLPLRERFYQHVDQERLSEVAKNKEWLQSNSKILQAIVEHYREYTYPVYENTDIDAALYMNGFWTQAENNICQKFHAAALEEKAKIIAAAKNPHLQELGTRILGRHFYDFLTPEQKQAFTKYMESVNSDDENDAPINFKGEKKYNRLSALRDIADCRKNPNLTDKQQALLLELEDYLS